MKWLPSKKQLTQLLLSTACVVTSANASAGDLELATTPLFLQASGEIVPNVVFSLAYEDARTGTSFAQYEIVTTEAPARGITHRFDHWDGDQNLRDFSSPPLAENDLVRVAPPSNSYSIVKPSGYSGDTTQPRSDPHGGAGSYSVTIDYSKQQLKYLFPLSDSLSTDSTKPHLARLDANLQYFSADLNILAYDPDRTYEPWIDDEDLGITSSPTLSFRDADPANLVNNPIQLSDSGAAEDASVYTSEPRDMEALYGIDLEGSRDAVAIAKRYVLFFRLKLWLGQAISDAEAREADYDDGDAAQDAIEAAVTAGTYPLQLSDEELEQMAYYTYSVFDPSRLAANSQAEITVEAFVPKMIRPDELQSYANWFQYHRRLQFQLKDLATRALLQAPPYRFGLYAGQSRIRGVPIGSPEDADADLTAYLDGLRKDLIVNLLRSDLGTLPDTRENTALTDPRADIYHTQYSVGQYFSDDGDDAPMQESCQTNFHLQTALVTESARGVPGSDGATGILDLPRPTSANFEDDGDTLNRLSAADLANHFYRTNIRPDLEAGRVLTNQFDPNPNPHVNFMAISVGSRSEMRGLDRTGNGFPDATDTEPYLVRSTWQRIGSLVPDPTATIARELARKTDDNLFNDADDLWHAALNGRGSYADSVDFEGALDGLLNALGDIAQRSASAVSVAQTSTTLQSDTLLFQARFNTKDRSGQLRAICIDANGNLQTYSGGSCTTATSTIVPAWEAGCAIGGQTLDASSNQCTGTRNASTHSLRKIASFDPLRASGAGDGIAFSASGTNFSPEQTNALKAYISDPDTYSDADATPPEVRTDVLSRRVTYLRGGTATTTATSKDGEQNVDNRAGVFHHRESLLGDIVNSRPLLVGPPSRIYPDTFRKSDSATTYASFASANASRTPMVYVGANDGMLHAFQATATAPGGAPGKEEFAYIPASVYPNLYRVADPQQFSSYPFVDGSLTSSDVWDSSGTWHTIVVGALRGGGQGVFALDITSPTAADESAAVSKVLWEFNDDPNRVSGGNTYGDRDLGFTYGAPKIVLLRGSDSSLATARWAVLVANGYNNTVDDPIHQYRAADDTHRDSNCEDGDSATRCASASTTGNAVLYLIDALSGALIAKMDTREGGNTTADASTTPNGLSSPFPVDVNGDFITDYVYAGDLKGKLWRFDLTGSTGSWDNSAADDGTISPNPNIGLVFNGTDDYPITAEPVVGRPPLLPAGPQTASTTGPQTQTGNGVMVYFGTGKYIESTDNNPANQPVQSFYGIWDQMRDTQSSFTRANRDSSLVEQCVIGENLTVQGTGAGAAARAISAKDITYNVPGAASGSLGWYMDLIEKSGTDASCGNSPDDATLGERLIASPILRDRRLFLTTTIPSDQVCDQGGNSWLMALEARTGGRLPFGVFNLDDGDSSVFDQDDQVAVDGNLVFASGAGIEGVASQPVISQTGDRGNDVAIITTTGVGPRLVSGGDGGDDTVEDNSLQTQQQNDGRDPATLESWRVLQ